MGCCVNEEPEWKKEQSQEFKFDFVNVDDFIQNTIWMKVQYSWVFLATLKSILVYMADIGAIVLLIASGAFESIINNNDSATAARCQTFGITFCTTSKKSSFSWLTPNWRIALTLVSIAASFVLLALEWRKSVKIVKSHDIGLALTSKIAYRYYSIRSFPHFCFFEQILDARKTVDVLAFFVYFVFRGWARLIFAEGVRQIIYIFNIYDTLNNLQDSKNSLGFFELIALLWNSTEQKTALIGIFLITFSCVIWIISVIQLIIAFMIYIPLFFRIQGNLKEYCVHKIDKRLNQLITKQAKKRRDDARRAELEQLEKTRLLSKDNSQDSDITLSNVGNSLLNKALPPLGMDQAPTLPQIDIDLEAPFGSLGSPRPSAIPYTGFPPSTSLLPTREFDILSEESYGSIPSSSRTPVVIPISSPIPHFTQLPGGPARFYSNPQSTVQISEMSGLRTISSTISLRSNEMPHQRTQSIGSNHQSTVMICQHQPHYFPMATEPETENDDEKEKK